MQNEDYRGLRLQLCGDVHVHFNVGGVGPEVGDLLEGGAGVEVWDGGWGGEDGGGEGEERG